MNQAEGVPDGRISGIVRFPAHTQQVLVQGQIQFSREAQPVFIFCSSFFFFLFFKPRLRLGVVECT